MFFRDAMMETLDEIMSGEEIKKIITTIKKYKYLGFFERRRELKRINHFIEEYNFVKRSGTLPHWIPTLHIIPSEIMRDLLGTMACKYFCEPYGKAEFIKEEEKDV